MLNRKKKNGTSLENEGLYSELMNGLFNLKTQESLDTIDKRVI